jgi:ABC-2 type transport system permease protein
MLRETWALYIREMKHWYRVKIQIFMALIQPIVWLGLFGQSFNFTNLIPGGIPGYDPSLILSGAPDYFSYLATGMLAVIALFTTMFAGMSLVWDRRFGFLTKLRVSPIPRGIVPISRMNSAVTRAIVQALIVLVIALGFAYVPGLVGLTLSPDFNAIDLLGIVLVLTLLAIGFSCVFISVALAVENQETLFGLINLLNLPVMFASAALFPLSFMPSWLQSVAKVNPLTWAADATRTFAFHNPNPIFPVWQEVLFLSIFAAIMVGVSIFVARKLLR